MGRGFWFAGDGCGSEGRGRWNWGSFDAAFNDLWGSGPRRRHARGGRVFEQGDLKFVILRLLEEKPRHGYDIIKELETRFEGTYAPSPGTVYPTLTLLEDMGYARSVPEEGGKKIFEITDEGRKHLAEHSSTVDDIFERMRSFVEGFVDAPMRDVNGAFKNVARATYGTATSRMQDKDLLRRIREVLERAAREIDDLGKAPPQPGQAPPQSSEGGSGS
jgi:DNA-binding PadR family transcriptional regulator